MQTFGLWVEQLVAVENNRYLFVFWFVLWYKFGLRILKNFIDFSFLFIDNHAHVYPFITLSKSFALQGLSEGSLKK